MDFLEKNLKIYALLAKAAKDDVSEVASIAVMNCDSLLMGKRRDNGRFTLPGGHLDKGEEKAEAAVRELFEETGIKVDQKDLKYLGSKDVTTYTGKKKKIHCFVYKYDGERPTTKHDPDKEVEKWEWVDCKDGVPHKVADNMHTPFDKNCLFQFLNIKKADEVSKSEFEIYKSNYGPKPMRLYNQTDNITRKQNRTGTEAEGAGPNKDIKQIASGGRDTIKRQAIREALEARKKSKMNPVKIYTPEEIAKLTIPVQSKKLAASELEKKSKISYEKETEQIKENKTKPEANRRHQFESAVWTHPNGHPRCVICGDEEPVSGMCEAVTKSEMKSNLEKQDFFDESIVPDWQQSYLKTQADAQARPENKTQPQEDDLKSYDIPSYVMEQLLNLGHLINHSKRGIIRNRKHVNRGDRTPLMRSEDKEGSVKLIHYSPIPGLMVIDPNHAGTSGVPEAKSFKYGKPETKMTHFYVKGAETEPIVTEGAKSKYTTSIHPMHLYDLNADPKGLREQAIAENQGAWNTDLILKKIKDSGYKGIWTPSSQHPIRRSIVQLFSAHPTENEEVLYA